MIRTMTGVLLAAAAAKAVTGLNIQTAAGFDIESDIYVDGNKLNDESDIDVDMGPGSVAAVGTELDPLVTKTDGTIIHVTKKGHYLLVGLPEDLQMDRPDLAQLMVQAHFDYDSIFNNKCSDLMIRNCTIQGYVLGDNITKLEFFINSNAWPNPLNSTTPMGLRLTNKREDGREQTMEFNDYNPTNDNLIKPVAHYPLYAPYCVISQPKGYIRKPNLNSLRRRSPIWIVECSPNHGQHEIKIVFSSVWRGLVEGRGGHATVYANDLGIHVGNVGPYCDTCPEPAGLMGSDDHTEATAPVPGCFKAQPIFGPFAYLANQSNGTRRPRGKHAGGQRWNR